MKKRSIFKITIATLLSSISVSLFASGFRLPDSSITGMSLSNAIVANHEEPGALIYNPALMSSQDDRRMVSAGIINISLDARVTPDNGTPADSQGESNVQLPSFYYMSKLNSQWSWGLGLHAPFGLETKWPANTFLGFSDIGAGALEPERSKLEVINLTPNVAFKIDSSNSVAFGINYYKVLDLIFNTQAVEIDADGSDYGFTLAYHFNEGPWSFGATYRSSVETHVEGNITASGLTADAEADIEFPRMIQIGFRNRLNKTLAIEFDIERTYWSSFDVVTIEHNHPAPPPFPNPIPSNNNWKDVNAYRLGLSYQLSNQTQLRFGYTIDETPQPDKYYSARIPDADRQLLSIGFAYKGGTDWEVEGGLMIVMFDDRSVSNTTPFAGGEPNGTTAYNGKYESDAILIGIGFSKIFDK